MQPSVAQRLQDNADLLQAAPLALFVDAPLSVRSRKGHRT
jgi:hypothetical protein